MTRAERRAWHAAKQRRRKARYAERLRMNLKPTPKEPKIPLAAWARIA